MPSLHRALNGDAVLRISVQSNCSVPLQRFLVHDAVGQEDACHVSSRAALRSMQPS